MWLLCQRFLSKRSESICWFCTELNELWSTSQSFSSFMHGQLLYWMALITGSFLFLIQFISSYRPHFLLAISSIFLSKKLYFIFLTVSLNFFQSSNYFDYLYLLRSFWQLLSHQALQCFVMLTFLEYLCHILSTFIVREFTISSSMLLSKIKSVLRFLIKFNNSSIKWSSSSLFLARTHFIVWMCSSAIDISIEMET